MLDFFVNMYKEDVQHHSHTGCHATDMGDEDSDDTDDNDNNEEAACRPG